MVKEIPPDLITETVVDVTYEQLSKLDVGKWHGEQFLSDRVPLLSDILKHLGRDPKRELYLDMKAVDLGQLASLVEEAGVGPQVLLASSDYAVIRE